MRTRTLPLAAALAAAALAVPRAASGEDRSLRWRLLDVDARLDARGDLHVRERQVLVFTGAWNGGERTFAIRRGQSLRLESIVRIDAAGERPLRRGDLRGLDRWNWASGADHVLRWRSRLPSDPPFHETALTYELRYVIGGALGVRPDGTFRLAHDFAFADRPGAIEELRARLALDPAWDPGAAPLELRRQDLPRGAGAVLIVPLRWVGAGPAPAAGRVEAPPPPPVVPLAPSFGLPLVALLAAALVLAAARVVWHMRARGLFDPWPANVDAEFLRANVLAHPPEVIGAAWDGRVAAPEVSAVLARLAAEGKLETRQHRGRLGLVRHVSLRLLVPRSEIDDGARPLVDALFFAGDETDSERLRRHYGNTGFDPAGRLGSLRAEAETLVPEERRRRPLVAFVLLAAAALAGAWAISGGQRVELVVVPGIVGLLLLGLAGIAARSFAGAVRGLAVRAVPVVAPLVAWAALVAWFPGHAGVRTVAAHVVLWAAGLLLVGDAARTRFTAEGVAARRRLVAARRWLAAELRRPRPRIEDAWIPWLLAFGLGSGMDRWIRVHGASSGAGAFAGSGGGAGPSGSPGWTGGGGRFSGGGATGTWAALGGLAAGVAAPSSGSSSGSGGGGGGGGGGSSGGGGGGGW